MADAAYRQNIKDNYIQKYYHETTWSQKTSNSELNCLYCNSKINPNQHYLEASSGVTLISKKDMSFKIGRCCCLTCAKYFQIK